MNTYKYSAMSKNGATVKGVIDAIDEFSAVEKIKANSPIVLKIEKVPEHRWGFLDKEVGSRKIDTKALSVMCSQFAIILASGVNIATCMEMISTQTEDKKLKKMLHLSAQDVAQGSSVATSFEKDCPTLPITFTETVRAGELSGTLEKSFATLEKYYEKSYKLQQKIKQALSYPIFVVCVAIVVLLVVMIKVIPTISSVFAEFGGDLPFATKLLIGMSNFFGKFYWLIIGIIAGIVAGVKMYHHSERGRRHWGIRQLRMPVMGKINTLNGCSQFANTMTALLQAGLPVSNALDVTSKVMDNAILGEEVGKMVGKIQEGHRLGDTLRACPYFPQTLVEMTAIGENTGELESTLETIGAYYTNEANHATTQALNKLEPTMLVLLAAFAGFIVISIYLPLFTMYNLM